MTKGKSDRLSPQPGPAAWHFPVVVEDIDEAGQHFELIADADIRAAVAKAANLRALPRLEARFDVTRLGADTAHVVGRVSATVGQTCVVTVEPLENEVEEAVDMRFVVPQPAVLKDGEPEPKRRDVKWSDPEPLIGGIVDLGAIAAEFLILGLDPYPRKAGAVFEPPADIKPEEGPFAALGKLAKG
ncbi:MAG: DUF177 domain-containing protein [Xanthobacteraceae bacterium]|jgi:hypothetical protein